MPNSMMRVTNSDLEGAYVPGRVAPPKYCGQTVEGVRHTRLTAYRLSRGEITLPARTSTGASAAVGDLEQGVKVYGEARPVSTARITLELLVAQVAEQITAAVRTAADPDAAAAEVSAAHRAARAEIDTAETERDQALLAAREAARTAQGAEERASRRSRHRAMRR
jgi:hypothetical protein